MNSTSGEPGEVADNVLAERVADLVSDVTEEVTREEPPRLRQRLRALLSEVARQGAQTMGRGVRATGRRSRLGARWLADEVVVMAPRIPVRDQATLRAQFPKLSPDELADALIEGSARVAAVIGATFGAWSVLPVVPAYPVEVAAETLALVGVEIKLVAELHEVYGMRAPGRAVDRMTAYVASWARRRGVALGPTGVVFAVGSPVRRLLQRRLAVRAGRSALSLGPLLTGAAAGALANRWETRRLGLDIRNDLRLRAALSDRWPN